MQGQGPSHKESDTELSETLQDGKSLFPSSREEASILFSVTYKEVVGARRSSWKSTTSIEQNTKQMSKQIICGYGGIN